jgi:hypothetical protein
MNYGTANVCDLYLLLEGDECIIYVEYQSGCKTYGYWTGKVIKVSPPFSGREVYHLAAELRSLFGGSKSGMSCTDADTFRGTIPTAKYHVYPATKTSKDLIKALVQQKDATNKARRAHEKARREVLQSKGQTDYVDPFLD